MKGYLFRLLNHEELSREEMKTILIGITQSEYPNEQITALLTALQMRGVTVDELLGFRDGILETGVPAILNADRYIDVVGTGGDRKTPLTSLPPVVLSLPVQVTKSPSTATMLPPPFRVPRMSSSTTALSLPMILTS